MDESGMSLRSTPAVLKAIFMSQEGFGVQGAVEVRSCRGQVVVSFRLGV